jgi:arylsulfatase A
MIIRLCCAGLLAMIAIAPSAAAARMPNVVLFLVDDLGARDLGCYGSPVYETPHVDAFAAQAVRFTQAYAACHVCSPTRASLLSGQYPARLQLTDWLPGRKDFTFQRLSSADIHEHLPLEVVTLAEVLREHGYATGHFGKWHLGEDLHSPLQQGFDVQLPRWNKGWPKTGYFPPFEMEGLTGGPGEYLTDRLTDEALAFIRQHQERPFFLYLSHFAVHDPIQGPEDLVEKYRLKLKAMPPAEGAAYVLEANPDDEAALSRGELDRLLDEREYRGFRVLPRRTVKIRQRQDNPHFAAMVESMDRSFGRVLATLKALQIEEDTIVIFTSDNGGMSAANFGRPERKIAADTLDAAFSTSNLPLRGGKGWLYEGGLRVPLLIAWPGQGRKGIDCNVPVVTPDLYATILEMLGAAPPVDQPVDGMSLTGLLQTDEALPREAIYWHFPHYSNHGTQSPGGAIRRGDMKLIEYFENGTLQLFNLREDPGEQQDLAGEQPELARTLQRMLHDWRTHVGARTMEPNPEYQPQ